MANSDLKYYAAGKGVRLWQVAKELGYSDSSFSRMLRTEFEDEQKQKIKDLIDLIADDCLKHSVKER